MARCLIGLGGNLGTPEVTLRAAIDALSRRAELTHIVASHIRTTAAAGGPAGQPSFANAVVGCYTSLEPHALLALLQTLEAQFGRQRREVWGPRTLDLDLLLYDQVILATPRLTLPHPRLAVRRFVLEPAVEIAGQWTHPVYRSTLAQLLSHVDSAPRYIALAGSCWFAKQYVAQRAVAELKEQGAPVRLLSMRGMTVLGAPPISDPDHPFSEHYVELLPRVATELREALHSASDWLLTTYWTGELELGAKLWFVGAASQAAQRAFAESFANVPLPQMLLHLPTPDDLLLFRASEPDHDEKYYEQARHLAAQRDALDQYAAQLTGVPRLSISADRPEAAIRELSAAIVALSK